MAAESEISLWKEEKNENIVDSIGAPPKGLEPLTDWLTASRSTWLSYGGIDTRHKFWDCRGI
jgi:hypothetical protein